MTYMANGLTRRNFLAGAVSAAALVTLAGCSPKTAGTSEELAETGEEKTPYVEAEHFTGICRGGCAGHCLLDIHVRDGKVVRTTAADLADTQYNRACSKGLSQVGRIYSEQRVKYPMRRVEGAERGAGEFERISWDEALDEIATKWRKYIEESGAQSIGYNMSSGNAGDASMYSSIMMSNVLGLSTIPGVVDQAQGFANSHIIGTGLFGNQNAMEDFKNSKTFICWGANPTTSAPQTTHFIWDAIENGTRYIVVDINANANTAKADWFVPVYPSTDGALALGALNYLLEQGWEDVEFIRANTEAPFFVKADGAFLRMSDLGVAPVDTGVADPMTGQNVMSDPYAVWDDAQGKAVALEEATTPSLESRTEVDGVKATLVYDMVKQVVAEYPVERVAELTGVSADDIRELARVYAQDGPVNSLVMLGLDHYINGHYNYWPIYTLAAFSGNMCKSGAAVGSTMSNGVLLQNFAAFAMLTDAAGNPAQGAAPVSIMKNRINEILDTKMYAGQPLDLRSIFITITNPVGTGAHREDTIRWMKRLDFVVVAEMTMSETAMYADILLPACHWFEQEETVSGTGSTPFYMWQEKAIDPLYESKTDLEIARLICERMGYEGFIPASNEEFLQSLFASESLAAMDITLDRVKQEKSIKYIPDGYIAYEGGVFPTATGKFSLYNENPTPQYNSGQEIDLSKERTLFWEPAKYADPHSEARTGKYPFVLFSTHVRCRTHTQWFDVGFANDFDPAPVLCVSPQDAQDLGLAEDDRVRVYNDFGSTVLPVRINGGLPQGMVTTNVGFNAFEFEEGSTSNLTSNEYNQMTANSPFNDCAVAIEKA